MTKKTYDDKILVQHSYYCKMSQNEKQNANNLTRDFDKAWPQELEEVKRGRVFPKKRFW